MFFKLIFKVILIFGTFAFAGNLVEGNKAPEFELKDQNGKIHKLSDYLGQKLVIYFFVRANTPPCKKQACGLRDQFKKYRESNISILGISYDPLKRLKSFKQKNDIQFDFLSDSEKKVAKSYGVDRFFFPSRKTFLIDENGVLVKKIDSVDIDKHADEILALYNGQSPAKRLKTK